MQNAKRPQSIFEEVFKYLTKSYLCTIHNIFAILLAWHKCTIKVLCNLDIKSWTPSKKRDMRWKHNESMQLSCIQCLYCSSTQCQLRRQGHVARQYSCRLMCRGNDTRVDRERALSPFLVKRHRSIRIILIQERAPSQIFAWSFHGFNRISFYSLVLTKRHRPHVDLHIHGCSIPWLKKTACSLQSG